MNHLISRYRRIGGRYLAGLIVLCLAAGCAVERGQVHVKDGVRYGAVSGVWRARWWNYYQRGFSYAQGAYWDEAIADFQSAIKQRRGRDDRRRARTYGVHYLDYFPHRELGIAYYHLGQYDAAQRELERSLQTVDTSKAKFYLNKVHQVLLEQSGRDTTPPRIVLDAPAGSLVTNDPVLNLRGHVTDDAYVSAISINNKPYLVELAEPQVAFEREVKLADGTNTIDLVAVDLTGKPTRRQLTVHLDREGPLVSLIQTQVTGKQIRIAGHVFDNSRITRLVLAGRAIPVRPETSWEFHETLSLSGHHSAVPFEVEDAAGNITQGHIDISSTTGVKATRRRNIPAYDPLRRWVALSSTAVMSDSGPQGSAHLRLAQASGPNIELRGLLSKELIAKAKAPLTLADNTIYIEGRISSSAVITSFTINDTGCWQRKSKQIFFGHKMVLEPGDNQLTLKAVDEQGNSRKIEIVVTHAVPQVKQLDSRLRLLLMPFELQGMPSELSQAVHGNFLRAMVNQERFGLVSQAELETLLEQLSLRNEDLTKPSTHRKVGNEAGAEGLVIGTVTENQQGLQVLAHYMDVGSTEVITSLDIYGEELDLPQLQTLIDGLAWKFKQQFPISQGFVLKSEGKRVFVDLGTPHGIKKYMKLVIFRDGEEIKHPITGKVLHTETELVGEAKVDSVFDDVSRAVLLKSEKLPDIKQLDRVITK